MTAAVSRCVYKLLSVARFRWLSLDAGCMQLLSAATQGRPPTAVCLSVFVCFRPPSGHPFHHQLVTFHQQAITPSQHTTQLLFCQQWPISHVTKLLLPHPLLYRAARAGCPPTPNPQERWRVPNDNAASQQQQQQHPHSLSFFGCACLGHYLSVLLAVAILTGC
jgi:hypothetical protein